MEQTQYVLRRVTPWVVSGASSFYALQRARRLSLAQASTSPLFHFLVSQSDVMLLLLASQIVWHLASRRRTGEAAELAHLLLMPPSEQTIHQLREIFAALTLGTGLLVRRLAKGNTVDIEILAERLHKIVNDGSRAIVALDPNAVSMPPLSAPLLRRSGDDRLHHERGSFPII